MIRFVIIIILISGFIGCQTNKTIDELKAYFYKKKPELDLLISKLEKNKTLDSLFQINPDSALPDIKDQFPNEYAILKSCNIKTASSHKNAYLKGTKWYYFRTNWPSEYPILLSYNRFDTYDSIERVKDFYHIDKYSNEWWGLGDGWQMLRLVKVIDYNKL
jgi:hypothetical protein